jgi:chromosome segregation ATPase
MPTTMPLADQNLWRKCQQQHDTYKATQRERSDYATRTAPLADRLHNNKASAQERTEFCSLLEERIKLAKRLYKERSDYIKLDCDKFDWFNKGTKKADRLADHQDALDDVDAELKNLYDSKKRFCQ